MEERGLRGTALYGQGGGWRVVERWSEVFERGEAQIKVSHPQWWGLGMSKSKLTSKLLTQSGRVFGLWSVFALVLWLIARWTVV